MIIGRKEEQKILLSAAQSAVLGEGNAAVEEEIAVEYLVEARPI